MENCKCGLVGAMENCKCGLVGTLSHGQSLTGAIAVPESLVGYLTLPTAAGVNIEVYDGGYIVIPSDTEVILPTYNKRMRDDVTVREIPYSETSNIYGGETVYIG